MGHPPSNGSPSIRFKFNQVEVGEMEAILQVNNYTVPAREILGALAQKFSATPERSGKVEISVKQVWNWFQNRHYANRAKSSKTPEAVQVNVPPVPRDDQPTIRSVPQAPHSQPPVSAAVKSTPQVSQTVPAQSVLIPGRTASNNTPMEFEAKSARDGAWYDVASFWSHRSLDTGVLEALVHFADFGPEEDEWVNIHKHVRQRSLPCESSECMAVVAGDLILCFQEGKEQALYFDAHVLDAQRRLHDMQGCRCRFLVRYDHDQSEEIVPLRKICRRPGTDFRLQLLNSLSGVSANVNPQKSGPAPQPANTLKAEATTTTLQQQPKLEEHVDIKPPTTTTLHMQPKLEEHVDVKPPTPATTVVTATQQPQSLP